MHRTAAAIFTNNRQVQVLALAIQIGVGSSTLAQCRRRYRDESEVRAALALTIRTRRFAVTKLSLYLAIDLESFCQRQAGQAPPQRAPPDPLSAGQPAIEGPARTAGGFMKTTFAFGFVIFFATASPRWSLSKRQPRPLLHSNLSA